jgi:hypothetical protein
MASARVGSVAIGFRFAREHRHVGYSTAGAAPPQTAQQH